jgi:hypothetical protein
MGNGTKPLPGGDKPRALALIEWLRFQGLTDDEAELIGAAAACILRVRRDATVNAKHPASDWLKEDCDQHLLAAVGHANLAARQGFGFKEQDGEDHLDRAVARTAMAAGMRERAEAWQARVSRESGRGSGGNGG